MRTPIENLETGDVLFCMGHGITSKLIHFFTGSKITHMAVVVWERGKLFIYDAQKDGFNKREYHKWINKYKYDFIAARQPGLNTNMFLDKIDAITGVTAYDFKLFALRFPYRIIKSKITGKPFKLHKDEDEDNRMVCSEAAMYTQGINDAQNFTPKDAYDYSVKNKWLFL